MGEGSQPRPGGLRWVYAGQGAMGAAAFDALLDRLVDAPAPRAVLSAEPPWGVRPVAASAEGRGVVVHHVDMIGEEPLARWPELFDSLDVGVVGCWTERIPRSALDVPAAGWLNLHPSALPMWRGLDPVAWQLLTAPTEVGCTVHRITEGQDDGAVLAQGAVPVDAGDDRGAVLIRSGTRLGELAAGVLEGLARDADTPERAQDPRAATWCPPGGVVPMLDPRALRARTGARIARAFSPQPGLAIATMSGDQRFAVAAVGEELDRADVPGAVVGLTDAPDANVAIAFRDRWLRGRTWAVDPDRPTVTTLGPLEL